VTEPATCKYLSAVTVLAGYNAIVINDGSGNHTVSLTPGTYYISGDGTASDLLYRMKTDFDTASSGHCTWTIDLDTNHKVRFHGDTSNGGIWHVDFSSGSTTFDPLIVGSNAITDILGADHAATSCTYVSPYVWYSTYAPESDSLPIGNSPTAQSLAKSGRPWSVQQGAVTERRVVVHNWEPLEKTKPVVSTANTNKDFWTFWETACAGQTIRYYPDVSVTTAYVEHSNPTGYYTAVFDEDTCRTFDPARYSSGVALYSWAVGLAKYV